MPYSNASAPAAACESNEYLLRRIHDRPANLFASRHLMCSEAVLAVLNQGLGGQLPPELAIRLASGFPEGVGGSGCTCGALSGGVVALGLFLGRNHTGMGNGRKVMEASRRLHDGFKARFGATCCRVLIRKVKPGSKAHFERCAEQCGVAAALAAGFILGHQPQLADAADLKYLQRRETTIGTRMLQLSNLLSG